MHLGFLRLVLHARYPEDLFEAGAIGDISLHVGDPLWGRITLDMGVSENRGP